MIGIAVTALTGTLTINQAQRQWYYLVDRCRLLYLPWLHQDWSRQAASLTCSWPPVGKKTLGLSYGLIATDLVLAPAIPSNTARAGGIVYPLARASAKAFGSEPDDGTAHKIGSFLVRATFQGNVITSATFLTAMAANPLAAKLASQMHVSVSWGQWAVAAIVPGIASLILMPLVIYKLYPPEIKETPGASQLARKSLRRWAASGRKNGSCWRCFCDCSFSGSSATNWPGSIVRQPLWSDSAFY